MRFPHAICYVSCALVVALTALAGPALAQPALAQPAPAPGGTGDGNQAAASDNHVDATAGESAGGEGEDSAGGSALDAAKQTLERIQVEAVWRRNETIDLLLVIGAAIAGLLLGRLVGWGLQRIAEPLKRRNRRSQALCFAAAGAPLTLALFTLGLSITLARLKLSEPLRGFFADTLTMLFAVAVVWYLYNLVELLDILLRRIVGRRKTGLEGLLVPIIRKTFRVLLVFVAVLFILDSVYEFDVGAWLAGLGIAGLAVSLAAQDSLKNVFGSITIFLDRPFVQDSFIRYAGQFGTVEAMGFRSTRMRTLDGHLLIIPNANIVNQDIENVGVRPYIRRLIDITIPIDTPPEKVQRAIEVVREIFELEGVREPIHNPDDPSDLPPRVFFSGFNDASLNILIYYWHRPGDWWPYLEHATRFNQALLTRFNAEGIDFAFPTQTLHLAGDESRPLNVGLHASPAGAPIAIGGNNAARPPAGGNHGPTAGD